jgi:hypothetical protein
MNITIERRLLDGEIERFYGFYSAAWLPMRPRAAARHLLTEQEFAAEMTDSRIDKYIAWSAGGRAVGLTTLTNELTAVPWIEPAFYATRHPDAVRRQALFYLGYTLVDPRGGTHGVFKAMADAVCRRVADHRGVLAFDICAHNTQGAVGRFAAGMEAAFGARVAALDTQTYYTADFDATSA